MRCRTCLQTFAQRKKVNFWKFSQRFMRFVQSFDVLEGNLDDFLLQDVFSTTIEALKLLNEVLAFGWFVSAFLACWLQFANKGNKSRKNVGMHFRHVTVVLWLERERVTVRFEFLVTRRTCWLGLCFGLWRLEFSHEFVTIVASVARICF